MSSVQGHIIFPVTFRAKQTKVHTQLPANCPLRKYRISRTGFWGVKGISFGKANVGNRLRLHNVKVVKCSFSSSSDGNGSMAENSNENDAEYVNSSVTDAGEHLLIYPRSHISLYFHCCFSKKIILICIYIVLYKLRTRKWNLEILCPYF